ncbi:hypothetical protein NDU88_001591 [Pleurodeles waltl]|uniref:Uncharacterized protein n=1 Tax=Pleurodeles waltl TaxID=8319 RepID=A0AAV7KTS6_PLEWA|nr:hypothetical protein NDU88_001591 [Pleurodeles waltl]
MDLVKKSEFSLVASRSPVNTKQVGPGAIAHKDTGLGGPLRVNGAGGTEKLQEHEQAPKRMGTIGRGRGNKTESDEKKYRGKEH